MAAKKLDGDTLARLFALTSAQLGETVEWKDPGAREFPTDETKAKELQVLKGWNGDTWTTHEFKDLRHVQVSSDKAKSILYQMILEFFQVHPSSVFNKSVLLIVLNSPQHRDRDLVWFTESFLRLVYHFCNTPPLRSSGGAVLMNTRRRKYDEAFLDQWDQKVGPLYARCMTADNWLEHEDRFASVYDPHARGAKVSFTCGLRTCSKQDPKMLLCSRCKVVRYCCVDHQREAWSMHKIRCVEPTSASV